MAGERDYKEVRRDYTRLKADIEDMMESLKLGDLKKLLLKLEKESQMESFWNDVDRARDATREISRLKRKIEPWEELNREVADSIDILDIALEENALDMLSETEEKFVTFQDRFDMLETLELLSGEDDARNAFISIHPGAGGTESQDWAHMLFKMYIRWAEKNEFDINVIDYTPGEEAGIKSSTILISGELCYGLLKCERGIHRLVRISPFDANKRRHTSFAAVDVTPELDETIDVEINEADLRIDTYRSSGAGGQHVNKTDSAVRITHLPTGIVVQCQNERSQHKNRAFAMKVLKSKFYELKFKEMEDKRAEKSGEKKDISWGNQIRSYVFQPYTLVKDHRTGEESGSIEYVLDGDIDRFIYSFLKKVNKDISL